MKPRGGPIVAAQPSLTWGIDATVGFTLSDEQVPTFARMDHCFTCCLGIHAGPRGRRFEALEPDRPDHCPQLSSDDFQREVCLLGFKSSPALVREPQGNGSVERFSRTL